jgi:hypothetical protein
MGGDCSTGLLGHLEIWNRLGDISAVARQIPSAHWEGSSDRRFFRETVEKP